MPAFAACSNGKLAVVIRKGRLRSSVMTMVTWADIGCWALCPGMIPLLVEVSAEAGALTVSILYMRNLPTHLSSGS